MVRSTNLRRGRARGLGHSVTFPALNPAGGLRVDTVVRCNRRGRGKVLVHYKRNGEYPARWPRRNGGGSLAETGKHSSRKRPV